MQTANLFVALFLTVTIGFGALAACFAGNVWREAGPVPAPRAGRRFHRRALRRFVLQPRL